MIRHRRFCKLLVLITTSLASPSWGAEKIVIEYWHQPRVKTVPGMKHIREYGDYERHLAKEFMTQHPHIEVRTQNLNWEDLPRKVPIAIMAGSPPDILLDFCGRTSGYWYQGVLEPLDDLVVGEMADLKQSWIDDNRIDGQLHAMPIIGGAQVLALNREIWRSAGKLHLIPQPDAPTWTLDEFDRALAAVAVKNKRYPLALQAASEQGDYGLLLFLWCRGAEIYGQRNYDRVILNSTAGVRGLQWLVDAHRQGWVPPNITSLGGSELSDLFLRGGSGCIPAGAALERNLQEAKKDGRLRVKMDLMFCLPPAPAGEKPKVPTMTGGFIVFKQTNPKKLAAVKQFVRFLSSAKALHGYSVGARMSVVRRSVPSPFLNTRYGKVLKLIDASDSVDMGVMSPHYYAVRRLLPPQLQSALLGQKTAQEALDSFCREAHAIIQQSKEAERRRVAGEVRSIPPWPVTLVTLGILLASAWIFRRQLLAP